MVVGIFCKVFSRVAQAHTLVVDDIRESRTRRGDMTVQKGVERAEQLSQAESIHLWDEEEQHL